MQKDNKALLQCITLGSAGDGKSKIIGELIDGTDCLLKDLNISVDKNFELPAEVLDLEKNQKDNEAIVYHRFLSLKRKFIFAEIPESIKYTTNIITGSSTANLAILVMDASNGVVTQAKQHGFIVSLLQIPHLVVLVNKMDKANYSQEVFEEIVNTYTEFCEKLDIQSITFIPVSAQKGDNIVSRSNAMPWYDGHTLLHTLDTVHIFADKNMIDFRFPVQEAKMSDSNILNLSGSVVSGTIRVGEEVAILPSGEITSIATIETKVGESKEAGAGQFATLTLKDTVTIDNGDIIVRKNNLPQVSNHFESIICWMDEEPALPTKQYIIKHTARSAKAFITKLVYRIDINTLHREKQVDSFDKYDIGRVEIKTESPLFFDPYQINRGTGSFILIDPDTDRTVASGLIKGAIRTISDIKQLAFAESRKSTNVVWQGGNVDVSEWEKENNHKAAVLWFTGLSGSGKSTVASQIMPKLFEEKCQVMLLDGDNVRHGLCGDLGFSGKDRTENIRRVGEVTKLFFQQGNIVICSFISPFQVDRDFVRSILPENCFIEVFVKCTVDTCKDRDPKGLYKKAISGEIPEFTGISSPYEEPESPEIVLDTDVLSVDECRDKILDYLSINNVLME